MSEYLVDIQHERLSFFTPAGEVKALNDVSIHLNDGEVLGIVGESGSGKSVTAYSLMGLTAFPGKLVGGTIDFNGHRINDLSEKEFRKIRGNEVSIIFQDPMTSLNPVYTIGNQIMEVILLHTDKNKEQARARAKELLELVGINEPEKRLKQYPHEFSGGQRQRIGIARALAVDPEFIVCDEPISALDVSIQAQVVNLLVKLQRELGLTYLFIAHDLSMVKHISDRVGVMYMGHIVELASSKELYANPQHPYTKALLSAIPIPNPEKEKNKVVLPLEGEVGSPINCGPGCRFASRCKYATKRCKTETPVLKEIEKEHFAACHLFD